MQIDLARQLVGILIPKVKLRLRGPSAQRGTSLDDFDLA